MTDTDNLRKLADQIESCESVQSERLTHALAGAADEIDGLRRELATRPTINMVAFPVWVTWAIFIFIFNVTVAALVLWRVL